MRIWCQHLPPNPRYSRHALSQTGRICYHTERAWGEWIAWLKWTTWGDWISIRPPCDRRSRDGNGRCPERQSEPRSRSRATRTGFWIPRFWDGMCLGGWFPLLVRNRFAVSPRCIAMAVIIGVPELRQLRPLAHPGRAARAEDRPHEDRGRSDLRDRPLAIRHDAAARAAGARPAAHLSRHLRLLRAEPFSGVGLVHASRA